MATMGYVVSQANLTVENLRNFSDSLGKAKVVGVDQIFLPSNVQSSIDNIETKLNVSANSLEEKSMHNSKNIKNFLHQLYVIFLSELFKQFNFNILQFSFSQKSSEIFLFLFIFLITTIKSSSLLFFSIFSGKIPWS